MTTWQLSDPVSVLPGCGPQKSRLLEEKGVRTIQDLLQYRGLAPRGVNVAQLRSLAELRGLAAPPPRTFHPTPPTNPPPLPVPSLPSTEHHSWYHLAGHILHLRRSPIRVQIGRLTIAPYGVVLDTSWHQGGQWQHRAVTPLLLACTYVLWHRREVVSEESEEETTPDVNLAYRLAPTELPWFEVREEAQLHLQDTEQDQLKLALREVHLFQQHSLMSLELCD